MPKPTPENFINSQACTLDYYLCPYCQGNLLVYDPLTRINTCPSCLGEVVTEYEYQRSWANRKDVQP